MSFKKNILNKFLSRSDDTEDSQRATSPFHNGKTWVIPETSSSEQEKEIGKRNEIPSTSAIQTKGNGTSSSKYAILKTDNSSVSPPTPPTPNPRRYVLETSSKILNETRTTSNDRTILIMGTSLNPIEPTTSGSPIEICTTTEESEESDVNKVLTSTPVKGQPPPLMGSRMETSSGDNYSIPSSILGSPSPIHIHNNSNYGQREPSSEEDEEEEKVQRELEDNLKRMKASIARDQQKRKRKFFQDMVKGELKTFPFHFILCPN